MLKKKIEKMDEKNLVKKKKMSQKKNKIKLDKKKFG